MNVQNQRYDRSFDGLEDGDLVEFYPVGHNPNFDKKVAPKHDGLVQVIGEPRIGENDRLFVSIRVKGDYQNPRVFADTWEPWRVSGAHNARLGDLLD